jgi:hypothetical protein
MSAAASVIFIYSLYFSQLSTFPSVADQMRQQARANTTRTSKRMGSTIGRLQCLYSADGFYLRCGAILAGGDGVPVLKVHMPLEPWLTVELAISSVVANGFTARSNSSSFFE